uniref:Fe2OG dioxygenase domain-containing protein n=1 Tax=Spongospora subterranea TaxID=70186 RepID=A0A0H5RA61_9EUKA|eukprot:CRZ10567.1 hypothetical protein [Spongospora subterranea]
MSKVEHVEDICPGSSPTTDIADHHTETTLFATLRHLLHVVPVAVFAAVVAVQIGYHSRQLESPYGMRLGRNGGDGPFITVNLTKARYDSEGDLGAALSPLLACSRTIRRRGDPAYEPCRLYHGSGVRVRTFEDLITFSDNSFYLVPPDRHFMWPPIEVGHKTVAPQIKTTDGRSVIMETISVSPKVFRVHNMLSEAEIDQIIKEARESSKTEVSKRYRSHTNPQRTAEDWNAERSETVLAIRNRTFSMLAFEPDVPDTWAEPFEMLIYKPGKCFVLHDDYLDDEAIGDQSNEFDSRSELLGSNRFATTLFYFTDVDVGGETVFANGENAAGTNGDKDDAISKILSNSTEADLLAAAGILPDSWEMGLLGTCRSKFSVRPQRGSIVMFYNQLAEGGIDRNAFHGGCPVISGEKIAANVIAWNGPTNLAPDEQVEEMMARQAFRADGLYDDGEVNDDPEEDGVNDEGEAEEE